MTTILKLTNIDKYYGAYCAVKNLNFTLEAGTALALLGPNGAGKSTAIQMMLGLRAPTKGILEIFGSTNLEAVRQRIGSTPQEADLPPQLTPREVIEFASQHYQNPMSIDALVTHFQLEKLIDRRSHGFSGGEKRRVALALAFCGNPELVFLDEPTNGLDVEAQENFQAFTRNYVKAGNSVVLTSHNWQEIERVADHIVMIDGGEKVIEGVISDLRKNLTAKEISFAAAQNPDVEIFKQVDGCFKTISNQSDALIAQLVNGNNKISNITVTPVDLQSTITAIRNQQRAA